MLDAPTATEGHRMSYSLVEPEHFTEEQQSFVERFSRTVEVASSGSGVIAGVKDIRSRHLTATDPYGKIVGLPRGKDVAGRMDHDMPCEGTAAFADCFVREDRRLLACGDIGARKSVLNIHWYATGLGARVFDKRLLNHRPSEAVLGVVYCAYDVDLARFTALFPSYWSQFGLECSIERTECEMIEDIGPLPEAEYETAFLLALGYDAQFIAGVLHRLGLSPDAYADTAISSITDRMVHAGIPISNIRDRLIEARVHQRMPTSLFDKVVGRRT